MILWNKKYQPKKLADVVGQQDQINNLNKFVSNFLYQKKKALLLYGPAGCGKTASVVALCSEKKLDLVDINASDFRNKDHVENILKPASLQASVFGGSKVILVDEIDGLSGTADRGAIPAIINVIKNTKYPLVLTANDPWIPRLRSLRKYCELVQFNKLSNEIITNHLKTICRKENIEYEELALKKLASSVDGDIRAAVNDLQVMTQGKSKIINNDIVLWGREKEETIFNVLKMIFKSFDSKAAVSVADDFPDDISMLNLWLDENISLEYINRKDRRYAHLYLSNSDIFINRISKWQYWRFLFYAKLMSVVGVQHSKTKANRMFVRHKSPEVLKSLFIRAAKRKKMLSIARQLSYNLHASAASLQKDFIPYFNFIRENNPKMKKELDEFLGI